MNMILSIALGGALGSVTRHYSVAAWMKIMGEGFWGTLFVNVLGSLVIGLMMELMALKWQVSQEMRAFMVTGFLGGFTTFSAFSFDVFRLVGTDRAAGAALYIAASVAVSVLAVFGGAALVRHLVA
jgi:CrcB protein